jgi:hypothetical protein
VQAKVLDTQDSREVAVVGVARVRASTACFVTMLTDIEDFKINPDGLRIRKIEKPLGARSRWIPSGRKRHCLLAQVRVGRLRHEAPSAGDGADR